MSHFLLSFSIQRDRSGAQIEMKPDSSAPKRRDKSKTAVALPPPPGDNGSPIAPPPLARPMLTEFVPIDAGPEQDGLELSYIPLAPEPPLLDTAPERPYTVMPSPDAVRAPSLTRAMVIDNDDGDDARDRSYTALPNNSATAGARQEGAPVPPGLLPPPPPPVV